MVVSAVERAAVWWVVGGRSGSRWGGREVSFALGCVRGWKGRMGRVATTVAVDPSLPRASREACAMWGGGMGKNGRERHALHLFARTDFLVQEAGNLGRLVVVCGGDDELGRARVLHFDVAHHVAAHGHGSPGQAEEEDGAPGQHGGGGQAETAAASRDGHD